jgi:hypothetical protein
VHRAKLIPFIVYLACGVAAVAVGGVGIFYTTEFSSGLRSAVCETELMVENTRDFIDGLLDPLRNISSIATDVIDNVAIDIADSSDLGPPLNNITLGIRELGWYLGNTTISGFPCAFCQTASGQARDTANEIDEKAGPVKDQSALVESVNGSVVMMKSIILMTVELGEEGADSIDTMLDEAAMPLIDEMKDTVAPIDKASFNAGVAMFGITMAAFAIILACIILMFIGLKFMRCFIHIAWMIAALAMVVTFFLSSFIILGSVVTSDVCVLIDDVRTNLGKYADIEGVALDVMNSCLDDTNLFDALNISDSLSFQEQLNFNVTPPNFEFTAFDAFHADVEAMTPQSTFGYPDTSPGCVGGLPACGDPDPAARIEMEDIITESNRRMDVIDGRIDNLEGQATELTDVLNSVDTRLDPMMTEIETMREAGTCGFVGERFDGVYDALCGTSLNAMLNVGIMMFVVAVLNLPMIMMAIMLAKRLQRSMRVSGYGVQMIQQPAQTVIYVQGR